jgi:nucleotidyltransferase/DNA polymerase involved in DNA repair
MSKLPIRKVPGIGKVTEKELNALEITVCSQILEKKHLIFELFSEKSCDFLLRAAMGLDPRDKREKRKIQRVSINKNKKKTFTFSTPLPHCCCWKIRASVWNAQLLQQETQPFCLIFFRKLLPKFLND